MILSSRFHTRKCHGDAPKGSAVVFYSSIRGPHQSYANRHLPDFHPSSSPTVKHPPSNFPTASQNMPSDTDRTPSSLHTPRPALNRAPSSQNSAEKGSQSRSPDASPFPTSPSPRSRDTPTPTFKEFGNLHPKAIGRAIGARLLRAAKRGNLAFLIVFVR